MLIVTTNDIPGHRIDAVFGEVMARMVAEAAQRGANAIVAMRFDTAHMANNWSEICAYGTAVYAIPLTSGEPGATGQSIQLTTPS